MKTLRFPTCLLFVLTLITPTLTQAAARLLPFQGRFSDANGAAIADGPRVVQFKIYDAPVGGRAVWNGEVQKLTVNGGLVSTILGTKAALSAVDFNQDLYLELTIDANADSQITLSDPPLLPRQSILPAVFAYESANAQALNGYDWSPLFGTNNPADGTLLDSKIADSSLTAAKIQDGAVTGSKLDVTGALAGQSLSYNGTNVVWSHVNALNAETLDGFGWSAIFNNANPATGELSAANLRSRGTLSVAGNTVLSGTLFASVLGRSLSLNNHSIFLRASSDLNHFVGYANGWFSQTGFDGPLIVGVGGGLLGTSANWTLRWNSSGTVQVRGNVTANGVVLTSDRNLKENFAPLDTRAVLDKVLALPVTTWNFKTDGNAVKHIGPMAQDFQAAFQLSADDKHISVGDEGGVSLAAIQGLNKKMEEGDIALRAVLKTQQEQIEALKAEIAALKTARE